MFLWGPEWSKYACLNEKVLNLGTELVSADSRNPQIGHIIFDNIGNIDSDSALEK